jgi:hypothetical protein
MENTEVSPSEPARAELARLLELARELEELPLEDVEPAPRIPDWE